MAREFLLAGVDPEELKPAPKMEPPKTPQGKWENFWYHYKWHFWGGLFALVVLVVLVAQMLSRNPADYDILLVTEGSLLDAQLELVEQELEAYGQDLDGDGEVEVNIQNCYLANPGSQTYYTNQQVIQTHLFAGDILLFMWEPKLYEEFMQNLAGEDGEQPDFLHKLAVDEGKLAEDGTVFVWDTAALREELLLENLPKELYWGVRTASGTTEKKTELLEQSLALLEAYANGKKTQTE